ncbi:anti-sigma factor antagonist [Streptosporangium carneum]|uniref:Anti-sigma factor antagonist n=1 Tax=Streptosporangium carneum TaxID=47481 RepID=A0A9W6HY41_9ACTN|nr:anti-sigma factor antagonist [Streptosporangium carneum]
MVVRAEGELDMAVAPRLRAELDRALELPGHPCVVVDLTAVPFCDSVGLGILVGALTRVRDTRGRLILVVRPGMITHLLTITNLDRHFETCGSLHEALSAAA